MEMVLHMEPPGENLLPGTHGSSFSQLYLQLCAPFLAYTWSRCNTKSRNPVREILKSRNEVIPCSLYLTWTYDKWFWSNRPQCTWGGGMQGTQTQWPHKAPALGAVVFHHNIILFKPWIPSLPQGREWTGTEWTYKFKISTHLQRQKHQNSIRSLLETPEVNREQNGVFQAL